MSSLRGETSHGSPPFDLLVWANQCMANDGAGGAWGPRGGGVERGAGGASVGPERRGAGGAGLGPEGRGAGGAVASSVGPEGRWRRAWGRRGERGAGGAWGRRGERGAGRRGGGVEGEPREGGGGAERRWHRALYLRSLPARMCVHGCFGLESGCVFR